MDKPLKLQMKSPRQSRSKAIVNAIFEATVRLLPTVGSGQITTKKIAELAGISIGSLYQYFPNKQSVMAALMDIVMKTELEKFEDQLRQLQGKSLYEATDTLIEFALDIFLKDKETIREIFMNAPELGRIPLLLKHRQRAVEKLAIEMQQLAPGRPEAEYVRVSFIAINAVMGVIHTMLYDETQIYTLEELRGELKIMLQAYFEKRQIA